MLLLVFGAHHFDPSQTAQDVLSFGWGLRISRP